jgi:hypothetical protein
MQTVEAPFLWPPAFSCLTLETRAAPWGSVSGRGNDMDTKRKVAFKAIGMVAAAFLAMTVTSGPADAASTSQSGGGNVKILRDSGWT